MIINEVSLMGNIGKQIALRQSGNGTCYAQFQLAVTSYRKTADGQHDTDWIDCVAFGNTASALAEHTNVGDRIFVKGSISVSAYTDKNGNAVRRQQVSVAAFEVVKPGKASRERNAQRGEMSAPAQMPAQEDPDYEELPEGTELPF